MKNLIKSVCIGTALCIATSAAQAVDSQGFTGQLVAMKINEFVSDSYIAERGSLVIHEGGGVNRKYQWGGGACNGKNLTEQNQNNLARVVSSPTVVVTPFFRKGVNSVNCLVGYRLQDRYVYIE